MNGLRMILLVALWLAGCDQSKKGTYCPVHGSYKSPSGTEQDPQCESLEAIRKRLVNASVDIGFIDSIDGGPYLSRSGDDFSCCYDVTYHSNGS